MNAIPYYCSLSAIGYGATKLLAASAINKKLATTISLLSLAILPALQWVPKKRRAYLAISSPLLLGSSLAFAPTPQCLKGRVNYLLGTGCTTLCLQILFFAKRDPRLTKYRALIGGTTIAALTGIGFGIGKLICKKPAHKPYAITLFALGIFMSLAPALSSRATTGKIAAMRFGFLLTGFSFSMVGQIK